MPVKRRTFLEAGMGMLGAMCTGCRPKAPGRPNVRPNVLWIVNDASRARNYSCYGYGRRTSPAIDKLAESGTLFERAYSQAFYTGPSVSSYMTGSYFPSAVTSQFSYACFGHMKVLSVPEDEVLAPSVFSASGYYTMVLSANLAFVGKTARVSEAFRHCQIPPIDHMERRELDGKEYLLKRTFRTMNLFLIDWLRLIAQYPFFIYLHGLETHEPYVIPDRAPFNQWIDTAYSGEFIRNFKPTFSSKVMREVQQEDADYLVGLYDGAIHYADHHLSLLFGCLEDLGILENTIVVYTSDHGEALLDNGKQWSHHIEFGGADETHHIPLVMTGPGIPRGKRIKSVTESIDILPTLMELCGVPADGYLDGRSLVSLMSGKEADDESSMAVTCHGVPQTGDGVVRLFVTGRDFKYEYNFTDEEREFLWRVPDTLAERRQVIDAYRDAAKQMRLLIERELVPKIELAANKAMPVAFCGKLVSMAWDCLPECRWDWEGGEIPEQRRTNWILDGRDYDSRLIFCLPAAGTSEVKFQFFNDIVRGPHEVLVEVLASSSFRGSGSSAFEIAFEDEDFVRIEVTQEGPQEEWRFVPLGSHAFGEYIVLRLRAANAAACLRRFLVYPDIPGAREVVAKEMIGDEALLDLGERTRQLEALGYL